MKAITITAIVAALAWVGTAAADEYVQGHTRSDGTYVQPYYRSSPNQYKYDNYSSEGNRNPYTGKQGTRRNEFSAPDLSPKNYYDGSDPW